MSNISVKIRMERCNSGLKIRGHVPKSGIKSLEMMIMLRNMSCNAINLLINRVENSILSLGIVRMLVENLFSLGGLLEGTIILDFGRVDKRINIPDEVAIDLISVDWRSVSFKTVDRNVIFGCDGLDHKGLENRRSLRTGRGLGTSESFIDCFDGAIWLVDIFCICSNDRGYVLESPLIICDPFKGHDFCKLLSRQLFWNLKNGR
ncbi:hypothetical protein LWI29_001322 [Acer saccharum]|uniref:Uncharacterized protein n=1 Tax=Acer saccharum TaxID=4024 RepID=A0AA39S2A4_ACESA|nr:hypothetical protein LWI29_001322 [Acer saccharum]